MERGTKGSKRGTARGARGNWEEGKKETTPCTYVAVTYVQRITERLNDAIILYITIAGMNVVLYIIIIRMNVVDNLNSV